MINVPMWVELRFSTGDGVDTDDLASFIDAATKIARQYAPPVEDNLTFRSEAGELIARFHMYVSSAAGVQAANRRGR